MSVVIDGTNGITTPAMGVGNQSPSNAGIKFPGTAVASSDANTLDDYEEGTFTPVITFGGASVGITYSDQAGFYTKIGNLVTCQIRIVLSNKGSSSGNAKIANLPFTVAAGLALSAIAVRITSMTFADVYGGYTEPSNTTIYLEEVTTAGTQSALTNSDFTNGTNIILTVSYRV
jgi:hypothetical protein